ncbi:MAG TPA: hypothetical protein VFR94_04825 [Nitrososphaeraceae archaeon]|nr:hypothetical protein [Nitrososphaeraceae archaeon]
MTGLHGIGLVGPAIGTIPFTVIYALSLSYFRPPTCSVNSNAILIPNINSSFFCYSSPSFTNSLVYFSEYSFGENDMIFNRRSLQSSRPNRPNGYLFESDRLRDPTCKIIKRKKQIHPEQQKMTYIRTLKIIPTTPIPTATRQLFLILILSSLIFHLKIGDLPLLS